MKNVCSCNVLLTWVRERATPVTYDPRFREFRLGGRSGYKIMEYCPGCGDRLPASRRPSVSDAMINEGARIRGLLNGVKSRKDLVEMFGAPDAASASGGAKFYKRGSDGVMHLESTRRTMIYRRISTRFDVSFFVGGRNDAIAFDLQPKRVVLAKPK